ncbi:MAG: cell division protein FtsQ/DivIB [Pseudomonadota bacterium]
MASVALVLFGAGALAFSISQPGHDGPARFADTILAKTRNLVVGLGFGLDQVGVTGAKMTGTTAVLDRIRMDQARTLFFFDFKAAVRRVEDLPWVAKAEITRRYPGQLHVTVSEREAFAVWRSDNGLKLIDVDGRVLAATNARMAPQLPVVAGVGAPEATANLMRLLLNYPTLLSRLQQTERILDRRWRLSFLNGSQIELPSDGEAAALRTLFGRPGLMRALDTPKTTVDLRVAGLVAVRKAGAVTATTLSVSGEGKSPQGG